MTSIPERAGQGRPRLVFHVTSHLTAAAFLPGIAGHLTTTWDVYVVSGPGEGLDLLTAVDGVQVVALPMAREPSLTADLRSLRALRRLLRDIDPDVVLTATPKAALLGTLCARSLGVPLVVHLNWGLRSETLRGLRRQVVLACETVTNRLSHHVIPNSRSLSVELLRRRMVRPDRVTVLGSGSSHGVRLDRFVPRSPGHPSPAVTALLARLDELGPGPVIGFVGRLNPDKGVPVLLEAVAQLNADGCRCRLMLVGSGEDTATVALTRQMSARGVPVLWLGPDHDTLPHFQAMDVHCLPTLREGFPNVCLEAAACAVPTVTTDATGAIDAVLDGVTGAIAPRGDVSGLVRALRPLLVDAGMRARLGRAARSWVEKEFAAEEVWHRHEHHLLQLYAARRRPGRRVTNRRSPTSTPARHIRRSAAGVAPDGPGES